MFFRIPLKEEGMYAYGQVATDVDSIFFDHQDKEDIWTDPLEILEKPIAFYATVDRYVLKEGLWEILGVYPVKPEHQVFPESFGYDVFKNRYFFWRDNKAKGFPDKIPCTVEETYGHEYLTSYGHGSIEQRLRDHFAGRPNYDVVSQRSEHLGPIFMPCKEFYAQYGYDFHWLDKKEDIRTMCDLIESVKNL